MPEVLWKDDRQGIYVDLADYDLLAFKHLPLCSKITASCRDLFTRLMPSLKRMPFRIDFDADYGNTYEFVKYRVRLTHAKTGRPILFKSEFAETDDGEPLLVASAFLRDPVDDEPALPLPRLLRNPDPPPMEFSCGFDRPEEVAEEPLESVPHVPHFEPHGHVPGDGVWHAPCAYAECVSRTRYDALYICAGCRRVRYCSAVCQGLNWRAHRASCQWDAAVDRVAAREGAVVLWQATTPCASVL